MQSVSKDDFRVIFAFCYCPYLLSIALPSVSDATLNSENWPPV